MTSLNSGVSAVSWRQWNPVFLRLLKTLAGMDIGISCFALCLHRAGCEDAVCGDEGHGLHGVGETVHIPFPFDEAELQGAFTRASMGAHKALQTLRDKVDLQHFCGYVTMLNASSQLASRKLSDASDERGESPFGFCGWNDRV
ncbi:protein FAM91A1 [Cricetulus griseus]|uniref:protein FAM91A1 n=1 Tax=Cricetulus griseus TaxID=10029 RepID=UPI0004545668|nr:protein FAM91A1 [Cricetulus griseus]